MMAAHHPEELIDRAMQGALGADERSTLNQHLAMCEACAGLLAQASWIEREIAPQPGDERLDQRAVEAVMARTRHTERRRPVGRSVVGPRWLRVAAAGVLLACGVTATAAIVRRKIAARARVDIAELPSVAAPATARSAPRLVAPPADVPAPTEQPAAAALPPRAPASRPAVTAAALFERAGELRRDGRADAAIAGYRRLQQAFPRAREAQLSFALAGHLLLERKRPREALAQFDRHAKLGGDVGEETLAGRADALEQLNRTGEAIAAWQSLLARYPGSIYAARARVRLAQLGERR